MFKILEKIQEEIKRANDLKEKELDLKILGPFTFQEKWGVLPNNPLELPSSEMVFNTNSTSEDIPPTSGISRSTGNPYLDNYIKEGKAKWKENGKLIKSNYA